MPTTHRPRAAIYARYSSDLQSDASIEDQIRLCRERIEREGWTYLQAYTDRGISGASAHLRPAYQALLDDARRGQFDLVVAEALDRLSRDQEDIAGLFKRLKFSGVRIVTLSEGEITELHVGLKGTMNAMFLKDLADKTRRGLRGRIEEGRSGGGLCYGYDVVRKIGPTGEPIHGERAINVTGAVVVRRIFEAFAQGKSPRRIAFDLNAEGIAGPGGGTWGSSTINGNAARGTGILNNELYVGRLVWNRLCYVKDPATGNRVSRLNPPEAWIVKDVPELRIVPPQLWQRVKARQAQVKRNTRPDCRTEKPFWDRRRPRFLFSGLMRCGCCGSTYVKISANLFGCAAARNKGTCSNRLNIRREAIEATILDGLRRQLMDPELFKAFAEEFVKESNRIRAAESSALDATKDELARVERRTRNLVKLITEDDAPVRALKEELRELEVRQDRLRAQMAEAAAPMPLLHPGMAELYRRKVEDLHGALENDATRDEAMELIRSVVDSVVLTPEHGRLRIDLKGELAAILALTTGEKIKPGFGGRALAEQMKLVAGRGFEPLTFRL